MPRRGGAAQDRAAEETRAAALDQALAKDPKDYKGWIALAEIRTRLGETEKAAEAIASARRHFSAAPFVLAKIDETARKLGLDLVAEPQTVGGPTAADIAAASDMSKEDQAGMIEGMVAGLAAKLEENPDNPAGWIMLVRSYSVLGDQAKARTAYETAVEHFAGNGAVLAQLRSEAGNLGVE